VIVAKTGPTEPKMLRPFVVSGSSAGSLPALDGIRAIAVILVVVFHCFVLTGAPVVLLNLPFGAGQLNLSPYLSTGFVAVDLFFVLSGFLLSQYWFRADYLGKPRPSTWTYARRRFFRIVPAYYCCIFLMLTLLCPFLIGPEFVYSRLGAAMFGAHLLFVQHLFPITSGSYNVNGALWTLTIEAMFYVLLPWMVRLFYRNRWMITLPCFAALTLLWLYLVKNSFGPFVQYLQSTVARYGVDEPTIREYLSRQFPAQLVDFGLGITLANLYTRYQTRPKPAVLPARWMGSAVFMIGVVAVLFCMKKLSGPGLLFPYYLRQISVSVGFTLMIAGAVTGGNGVKRALSISPLRLIGLIGYSAYLWHMPLIYVFNKFPSIAALPPFLRFGQVLWHTAVALLLMSIFFYLTIEKPFLVLGRKRPASETATVVVPPSPVLSPVGGDD
jgi:peptidoglycan/LPS O-acetylase OafA/YrhL